MKRCYGWLDQIASVAVLCVACAGGEAPTPPGSTIRDCEPAARRCSGSSFEVCDAQGHWTVDSNCGAAVCDADLGCVACAPNNRSCDGPEHTSVCRADGSGFDKVPCDEGAACSNGTCVSLCEEAAAASSYLGCEYWPTVTPNVVDDLFDFAVVVANPNKVAAKVRIERLGFLVERTLAPGEVASIKLPWVRELKEPSALTELTARVHRGAYRLTSSVPIAAYQFNPLQYKPDGQSECIQFGEDNPCSYTNDASLLLPTSVLGTDYIAISWPTADQLDVVEAPLQHGTSGFVTVVATQDATSVVITSSAHTQAGVGVPAMKPGDAQTVTLQRGDVLLLSSAEAFRPARQDLFSFIGGPEYDLTGSRITADKPVAVFGGHMCTYVPFNREACDHLEEQILPLNAWGSRAVAHSAASAGDSNHPNLWRITSGAPSNTLTFDPPTAHAPVTLAMGQTLEFEYRGGFEVRGTGRLLVAQFMVGDGYGGDSLVTGSGDPSFGLVPPVEQFRRSYDFLVPDRYVRSFVDIIAPNAESPRLNGAQVTGFVPIGSSGFGHARVELAPGPHHIESNSGVGITVSGHAPWTSYLFPGGMDVAPIIPK